MKPTLRQRRILRKLTTPMDPDAHIKDDEAYLKAKIERFKSSGWNKPKPSFFRYLLTGGKSGKWWIFYWIMMALFWALGRPWYYVAMVQLVTLSVFVYGTWRNYHGKQA